MKAKDLTLGKLLSFRPKGGILHFMGHRAILMDASALGLMRKDLISSFGLTVARNILTRFGYAQGWLTADNLGGEFPELLNEPICGPILHSMQGVVNNRNFRSNAIDDPVHNMTSIWEDSFEAEQHICHLGISDEPVCWTLTGFVSGYISRMLGRETYCIEHRCQGKGDALCHIESRTREDWGDLIDEHLPYFKEETIDGVLKDVTKRLRKSERKLFRLKRLFNGDVYTSGIIAGSEAMRQLLDLAKRAAKVDSPVVVVGESGVGKEMVARFIHDESPRAGKPFVAINCSAITETLLESEFFGHSKGAFTGADSARPGLFEAANSGTLLLDEIAEMPQGMQSKLLRVLQEKEVRRVGENTPRPVDVKIIAATNRDLEAEVEAGHFRRDLYYRICVIQLEVPPLRDRVEDILPLARFFLNKTTANVDRSVSGLSSGATEHLLLYPWPGNVRELQNTIERAVALCSGRLIQLEDLPVNLRKGLARPKVHEDLRPLAQIERNYIMAAMEMTNGNKKLVAEKLNIGIASLYRKLKLYEMEGK